MVLFQLDAFDAEARDLKFGLGAPLKLSRRYGASAYASIRRYVSGSDRACAVLVLEPPVLKIGAPYNRATMASLPTVARSAGPIAPGARGRLALILDGAALPAEDETLTLDLQVRRGAAQTELSADLVTADFGSDWWPF